jgi:hypothetical protein
LYNVNIVTLIGATVMTYEEQLKIEKINKETFNYITTNVSPEEFINFYKTHNQKETLAKYNIRTTKILTKILKYFNYDFSYKKCLNKGKPATRSHESYIIGGKKSGETQKKNWENKSEEEKAAWSIKQSIAHLNSPTVKDKITESNRKYRYSLTPEERTKQNSMRSASMKSWWESLSDSEKEAIQNHRFINGRCYHSKSSGPNTSFQTKLNAASISFVREFCLDHKTFDFKINDILVEINPTFTHNATFFPLGNQRCLDKNYHRDKTAIAEKYNYRCVHIFDWDDPNKIIESILNKSQETVYARNCEIREVPKQEAIDFIFKHHIQNYAKDTVRLGLYYKNELVSIMTFGKPRYNKKYEYEIIRYCSAKNVIGGSEKLFKHFVNTYLPESIISYCDLSKFTGKVYEKLGFTLLRKPAPSKHWYNMKTKEHYTDALVRQHGFSRLINHKEALEDNLVGVSNKELMLEAGFVEVYDCGQATYVWHKE